MKFSATVVALSLTALVSLPSLAAPVRMTDAQLDLVVAGTDYHYCPPETTKGNNGWGNGADGTNAGSLAGGTGPSKSINGSNPAEGKININPTTSSGR
jgi:hypothetical protein